jgi:hypothetical protein
MDGLAAQMFFADMNKGSAADDRKPAGKRMQYYIALFGLLEPMLYHILDN